jgi:flagellar motility protein MotE (MotC chaperone)
MKKILLWSGIGVVAFVALVGIIFVVLTYLEPVEEELPPAAAVTGDVNSTPGGDQRQVLIDSLENEIQELTSKLFFVELERDSLLNEVNFKEGLIEGFKKTIEKLNQDLLAANKRAVSIKELAKTYETMKVEEMRPILKKIDDETVIAIYRNMSSRNRKNLFQALSDERAAAITKRLAGVATG